MSTPLPFQDEIKTCIAAGYSVRALAPVDAYELCSHITNDRELTQRVMREEMHGSVLPYGSYDLVLGRMSKAELAALRARVDRNR